MTIHFDSMSVDTQTVRTSVDAPTVTNANLVVESLNPMTIKLNDTDALQLDNAAIASFAAATDTAGNDVFIETEDAGASATAARTGGALSIKNGDGSAGATTVVGGAGGALTLTTGGGGAQSGTVAGGAGGALGVTAGAGGANTGAGATGAGGAGGALTGTAGAGGATNNTGGDAGGAGGAVGLTAGAGGAQSGGTGTGGAGGAQTRTAGAGGANTGAAATGIGGAGGAVTDTAGAGGATNNTGASAGGAGGALTRTAGVGGAASAGTGNGGKGGSIIDTPGAGGTSAGGSAGKAGMIAHRGFTTFKATIETDYDNTADSPITAADLLQRMFTMVPTAAATIVLPSATLLVAELPDCAVGDTFTFYINNASGGANTITLQAGADGSADGTMTIAQNVVRGFVLTITNVGAPAYEVWGLGA